MKPVAIADAATGPEKLASLSSQSSDQYAKAENLPFIRREVQPFPLTWHEKYMANRRGTEDFMSQIGDPKLYNFALVEDFGNRKPALGEPPIGLYRGAMLESEAGYEKLRRQYSVGTVIDLRGQSTTPPEQIEAARNACFNQKIRYVHVPLNSKKQPGAKDYETVRRAIADARKRGESVYIHCKHGVDRTGLMVFKHEVGQMNVPADVAFQHMKTRGYNPWHQIRQSAMQKAALGSTVWEDMLENAIRDLQALLSALRSGSQSRTALKSPVP